ncbi:MAG: CopG family transcriptional regulator [Micrococcales bacterium]|nr:CopG family transcriptional regulator [Micrococcales bacterium]
MTMTLRMTEDEERALDWLARAEGVSKREAAVRAIKERAARLSQDAEVRGLTRQVATEYAPLLDRLAQ